MTVTLSQRSDGWLRLDLACPEQVLSTKTKANATPAPAAPAPTAPTIDGVCGRPAKPVPAESSLIRSVSRSGSTSEAVEKKPPSRVAPCESGERRKPSRSPPGSSRGIGGTSNLLGSAGKSGRLSGLAPPFVIHSQPSSPRACCWGRGFPCAEPRPLSLLPNHLVTRASSRLSRCSPRAPAQECTCCWLPKGSASHQSSRVDLHERSHASVGLAHVGALPA